MSRMINTSQGFDSVLVNIWRWIGLLLMQVLPRFCRIIATDWLMHSFRFYLAGKDELRDHHLPIYLRAGKTR